MGNLLQRFAIEADGRYFSVEERTALRDFATSIPSRLAAMENIEKVEEAALRSAIEQLQGQYPDFARYHDQAWARHYRDLQLVLRAAAVAMVLDDPAEMEDRLLFWLRTMFAANQYTPEFVRDSVNRLRESLDERLDAETAGRIQPYLKRAEAVLAEFPEPATAAV